MAASGLTLHGIWPAKSEIRRRRQNWKRSPRWSRLCPACAGKVTQIHIYIYIYIYINTYTYIYIYTYGPGPCKVSCTHIRICMYNMYICICVTLPAQAGPKPGSPRWPFSIWPPASDFGFGRHAKSKRTQPHVAMSDAMSQRHSVQCSAIYHL